MAIQWLRFHVPVQGGAGSIPGQGTKIPHASWSKYQNINNKSNTVTNSLKTFKVVHVKKKKKKKKNNFWK